MSSRSIPKKSGGRPRKHPDAAAATEAKKQSDRLRYLRSLQSQGPVDFIAFEPSLHTDIPAETCADTGLRTDILIPHESGTEHTGASQIDIPQHLRPISPPPTQLVDEAITAQITQIRIDERAPNPERDDYEAEIAHQLHVMEAEAVESLIQMAGTKSSHQDQEADGLALLGKRTVKTPHVLEEDEEVYNEQHSNSCFPADHLIEEPMLLWDDDNLNASETSNRAENISRSQERTLQPHTPTQRQIQTPPSISSSKQKSRSANRRSTSFPLQKNTLMSWVRSSPPQLPPDVSPNVQRSPPEASRNLVEHIVPPSLAVSVTPSTQYPPPWNPLPTTPATPRARPADATNSPTPAISTPPAERTALKLAKQLRHFQGCSHEQHQEADQLHREHHQRPDVHSKCSSLQEITTILRGDHGTVPLPDVLSSAKLMKPMDLGGVDCQAIFEGTSLSSAPEEAATRDEELPKNLCLSQRHISSRKSRPVEVSFDIDSTCCFPTSLAVACQGINWFPKAHPMLNLDADIHFGLRVPCYNKRGLLSQKYEPLHKISHYCFGSLIGMEMMLILIFFPALHVESNHEHTTYLSKEDYELFYDGILSPAINQTVKSPNIVSHYPATARIASLDATVLSRESLGRKDSSREQLLKYALQSQYLDALWTLVLQTIADNPAYDRFQGVTLFMHAKNTKLEYMNVTGDLNTTYEKWQRAWSQATNPEYYNQDRTFVDLAKQTTSEDSALPYDQIPDDHEAEVFLWKKCCLDAYARTRRVVNPDGSPAKGSPKRTTYPWATMRDTIGQTFFAAPHGQECQDGLIYSQFYALIKTPFDTSKVYVFDNEALENLALDPGYIRSLQQEGGGITFSKGVCEFGYLHGKERAHANLVDNQWKSYGIREEHRISLTMMEEIAHQWRQWDLYDDEMSLDRPLPYYIVPTAELLEFLHAQINKYCFLFENVLAHTAMTYSLPETVVMVTALRALRFCYGSNLLQRESLLYKDRWESQRGHKSIVKEGLGMRDTMERCGLGWFLPKFNWSTFRLAPPHGENLLVGNVLMHEEYKRRWRAVKDLRDVFVRFNQADSWYDRYHVQHNPPLLSKWLEYLHVLNLEQFDTDIWKAMLRSHKRSPELTRRAIQQNGGFRFCHRTMRRMFSVDGVPSPPHFVTGNKMRFERVNDLLNFLFLWEDGKERLGWANKPYRIILQKSFELIERRLGYRKADQWLDEFFLLVRLTHWELPYPSESTLVSSTKTSRNQGLKGRMMWFSAVYADPERVQLPFQSHPITLYGILWNARRQTFGDGRAPNAWVTSQLITACRNQGLKIYGEDETEEFWVAGRRSVGLKGFAPVWERTQPPKLKMLEQTKNKSLDELEDLMGGYSREYVDDGSQDGNGREGDLRIDERGSQRHSQSVGTSKSIMAAFARTSNDGRSRGSDIDESITARTDRSGSIFVPSGSEG